MDGMTINHIVSIDHGSHDSQESHMIFCTDRLKTHR